MRTQSSKNQTHRRSGLSMAGECCSDKTAALTLLPPVSCVIADVGGAHEPGQLSLVASGSPRRVLDGCLQVRRQGWLGLLLNAQRHSQPTADGVNLLLACFM